MSTMGLEVAQRKLKSEILKFRRELEDRRAEGATDFELLGMMSAQVDRVSKQLDDLNLLSRLAKELTQTTAEVLMLRPGKRGTAMRRTTDAGARSHKKPR